MELLETCLSSDKIFQGDFLELYKDQVELPDGKVASREYVKHSGASCIIALNADNEVIVEYQYRYPVQEKLLEFPAGKLDANETLLECAKRELAEETGYTAKNWVELGCALPCIAYSTEKIAYFLATQLIKGETHLDSGEFLEVSTIPVDDLIARAYAGEIKDSKTLAGLMLYLGYRHRTFQIPSIEGSHRA